MVPLRGLFEALGAQVSWDPLTRTVTALRGSTMVMLTVGQNQAQVNGATVVMDVPSVIVDDTVRVPLRFVSEALGDQVNWDQEIQTISITQTVLMRTAQALIEEWGITTEMMSYEKIKLIYDGLINHLVYGI